MWVTSAKAIETCTLPQAGWSVLGRRRQSSGHRACNLRNMRGSVAVGTAPSAESRVDLTIAVGGVCVCDQHRARPAMWAMSRFYEFSARGRLARQRRDRVQSNGQPLHLILLWLRR